MKRIISLALVLVMAMALLTACGTALQAPSGVYSSESGSYKVEFTGWDEKENVGNMTITFTIMDTETKVSGTFSVLVNEETDTSVNYAIDFTPDGGEVIEGFMVFDPAQNVVAQYQDAPEISGANTTYYAGEPAAE